MEQSTPRGLSLHCYGRCAFLCLILRREAETIWKEEEDCFRARRPLTFGVATPSRRRTSDIGHRMVMSPSAIHKTWNDYLSVVSTTTSGWLRKQIILRSGNKEAANRYAALTKTLCTALVAFSKYKSAGLAGISFCPHVLLIFPSHYGSSFRQPIHCLRRSSPTQSNTALRPKGPA